MAEHRPATYYVYVRALPHSQTINQLVTYLHARMLIFQYLEVGKHPKGYTEKL